MNELPSRDEFFQHLDSTFRVFFNEQEPTEVSLIEVSEVRPRSNFAAFSLVFLAPKTILPEQRLYRVEHDSLGEMVLFLVPFEENEKGFCFEALFNQPIKAAND